MNLPLWLTYAIVTLLASVPFYWQIRRQGGVTDPGFPRRLRMMMWIPGIVALGFRFSTGEGFADIGYGIGRWPYLLVGFSLPILVEVILITIAVRFKLRAFSPEIVTFKDGQAKIGPNLGLLIRRSEQSVPLFLFNLLISTIIGGLVTAVYAFGQEFGWRGYLQGQAVESAGLAQGLILVGLVWAAWYFPLIQLGYRFPDHPGFGGFLLMPLGTIALSVIAGWLYNVSGSIWAPTLFHTGVLVSADFSLVGLGDHGRDLRLRTVWVLLWVMLAILPTFFWPA
jgi:membrane protease YdiL (CAAX protease family)